MAERRSKRCPTCLTNWPLDAAYGTCPECGDKTSVMTTAEPIPDAEPRRRESTAEFEEWLVLNGRA